MLNGQQYYWGTTRKAVVAFGNLFNDISLVRDDGKGKKQKIKVPLAYGAKDKTLARILQQPNIEDKSVAIVVPRMAFELAGFAYDAGRKLNSNTIQKAPAGGVQGKIYTPVPYNLGINLFVFTKSQDDAFQIVEQIIPTFRPTYCLSMQSIPELGMNEDLHVKLENVSFEDNYEGEMTDRRMIVWTFSFILQLNYHPYADMSEKGLIKRTEVGLFGDTAMQMKNGDITNEVVPFDADATDKYEVVTTFEGLD